MARPVVLMSWVEVGSQALYVGEKPSAEHAETGAHYVSVLSGKRLCLALGPFDCHSTALGHVDRVKSHVRAHYRDSWTYGFGDLPRQRARGRPSRKAECRPRVGRSGGEVSDRP
jgi:hypothetical protein